MKTALKWITWAIVGLGIAAAQQQNTVFQTVVINRNTPGTFAITRNIGQSAHLVAIVATASNPPFGCATITGSFRLQGSFDNVDWITIQQVTVNTAVTALGSTRTANFTGVGAYPYLQLVIVDLFNTSTCGVSLYYSGALNIGTNSSNYQIRSDNFVYASGITLVGGSANIGQCIGTAVLSIYSMVLINQNASALTATARLYSLSNTFAEELLMPLGNIQGNSTFVLPTGPKPYAALFPSQIFATRDIILDPGAAGQVRYNVVYRCE